MDRLDIAPRRDWNDENTTALAACSLLIVVLTPDYIQTPAARNLLQRMSELNRPIIPVMLQTLAASDYPTEVDYRQSIAMEGWLADHIYASGLNALTKALEGSRVVLIADRLDPERRYVNSLNMLIETYKSYLEVPAAPTDFDEHSLLMLPPLLEANWGIGGMYIDRGTAFERTDDISHLPYWASQVRRFVLIAGNGVGKTTTIMRLMSEHVHEYLRDNHHTPVPLFIDLSHWNPEDPLDVFIAQQVRPLGDPTSGIHKGRYAVYVDGLSELGVFSEMKLAHLRQWLQAKKAPQRIVIACDENLYSPKHGLDLTIVQMLPVTEGQRRSQVAAYMGRGSRPFLERFAAHQPARRWESSALLLRAAMYHYRVRPKADFPANSERLIIKVMEMLCEREQVRDNPDWIDFYKLLPRVAYLAYRIMFSGHPYSITPEQAVQFLGSEGLLHTLVSARVLTVRMKRVKFWHRSLLNVFAAYHLQKLPVHKQLAYTEFDGYGRRVSHYWDAPMVALTGILDDAGQILQNIAEVDPYLALEAMAGRQVNADVQRDVLQTFMQYAINHQTIAYSATLNLLDNLTMNASVPLLLGMLRSGSWDTRVTTHEFLLRLPFPVAADLAPFQSWDGVPSDELAESLKALSEEVVPLLLRMLHSANSQVRIGAAWALGVISDEASTVGLVTALDDPHPDVRLNAAQSLRQLPQAAAVPALIRQLSDENWRVRKAATSALVSIGVSAVPALRRLLQSDDLNDKRIAIGVLGHIGDASVVDDLLPYVQHESSGLRAVSVIALGQLKATEAVAALAACAHDTATPSWSKQSISELAQQALESIGTEEAMGVIQSIFNWRTDTKSVQTVKSRLKKDRSEHPVVPVPAPDNAEEDETLPAVPSPTDPVLASAILPTLPYEDDDELDVLLKGLQQPFPARNRMSMALTQYALKQHKRSQPDVLYRLQAGLYSEDIVVRESTVEALGYIADPSTSRSLIPLLADPVWTIRMATIRALAEIGDSAAVAPIAELLQDKRSEVREVAAESLGIFQRKEAVPLLINALDDEQPFIRLAVIRALGRIGDSSAVMPLLGAMQIYPDLRQQALILEALGKIGSSEAVEGIGLFLGSAQRPPLRDGLSLGDIAAHALERIGTPNALKLLAMRSRKD